MSKTSSQIDGQPMFKTLDKVKKLENEGKKNSNIYKSHMTRMHYEIYLIDK